MRSAAASMFLLLAVASIGCDLLSETDGPSPEDFTQSSSESVAADEAKESGVEVASPVERGARDHGVAIPCCAREATP